MRRSTGVAIVAVAGIGSFFGPRVAREAEERFFEREPQPAKAIVSIDCPEGSKLDVIGPKPTMAEINGSLEVASHFIAWCSLGSEVVDNSGVRPTIFTYSDGQAASKTGVNIDVKPSGVITVLPTGALEAANVTIENEVNPGK